VGVGSTFVVRLPVDGRRLTRSESVRRVDTVRPTPEPEAAP
jgi:hypothetical protein